MDFNLFSYLTDNLKKRFPTTSQGFFSYSLHQIIFSYAVHPNPYFGRLRGNQT